MNETVLLREILDAQLEMVCRFRADGCILFANRAYAASLGMAPEELTGKNLWDFVTGADRAHVQQQLDQLTPENTEVTIENRFETSGGPRWTMWKNHGLRFDSAGQLLEAQSTGIDITERKLLEQQLEMMIEELNHRVKNTLMVVQSLAWQTFRNSGASAAMATFTERLGALASAHTTLSRASWVGADLAQAVRQSLPVPQHDRSRIAITGPTITLAAPTTVPVVMALHELATNALKYGALSVPQGSVSLSWTLDAERRRVSLDWCESDGPRVEPPQRAGFGTRLITELVSRQLGGDVALNYDATGVRCRMTLPLEGGRRDPR